MRSILILVFLMLASVIWCSSSALERVMNASGISENMVIIDEVKGDNNSDLVMGIAYHNMAGEGLNSDFIKKSIELLEGEYKRSDNPLALGFWGSALTIRSSYEYNSDDVLKSLSSLEKGLSLIDKSVEIDPTSLDIRFLRLINSVEVAESSPLNRDDVIEEDIKYFDSILGELSKDNLAQYLYFKARYQILSDDVDEAIFSLERALTVAPGSDYAVLCDELLLEWEE